MFDNIKPEILDLAARVEARLSERFAQIDAVALANTARVAQAYREERLSDMHFAGTTGYGYDDAGRELLDRAYARVFGAESALVRIGFVNGTHAITAAIFSALAPGDTLLSVTGAPYDTIRTAIGVSGNAHGSLKFYGVNYAQVDLAENGEPDYAAIEERAAAKEVAAVLVQRSRGYGDRRALTVSEIGRIAEIVHRVNPRAAVICDNCYGEFCEEREPTAVGADLIAGSLIKNAGGGLAPTGGYIAGRADLVENAAQRLTTPGIGGECGATLGNNRLLIQGFITAPHTVAQALKTACLCAGMLEELGYKTSPSALEPRSDIIQMVRLDTADNLKKFCVGIQHGSPVDSYVTPEPWQMPGYDCEVIMAAGAFIQGSSIELSADGPMKEPYLAYLQGGLTYELGKYGIISAINEMTN
jgi:cystathionine beta-lyase family protein involved in aluminum resistance